MESLKKMLQRKAEQAERKRIREEKKKEKELLKLQEKKEKRKKMLRHRQNQRYYKKTKIKKQREREKIGEEIGFFRIILTKNRKRFRSMGQYHSKIKALRAFNNAIEKNQVSFPVKILTTSQSKSYDVLYEILLIKSEKQDENGELKVVQFRNAEGKFVDNVITDSNKHVIVDKHVWNVEETFHVYGYHPVKDRKDFNFILNELLLKNLQSRDDTRSVQTYLNKVIIKYYNDFDFIICKNSQEANRLVVALDRNIPPKLKKYVLLLGEVNQSQVSYWLDKLVEKTGWSRQACRRNKL